MFVSLYLNTLINYSISFLFAKRYLILYDYVASGASVSYNLNQGHLTSKINMQKVVVKHSLRSLWCLKSV